MKLKPIQWTVLFSVLSLLPLCLLSGCQQKASVTDAVKSTPVLIDKAAAASVRVGEGLATIKTRLKELWEKVATIPGTLGSDVAVIISKADDITGDNDEVQVDLGVAAKQAAKDAEVVADQAHRITDLEASDPYRTTIRWTAYVLTVGGLVVGGALAICFRNINIGWLAGWVSVCGLGLGLLERLLPTLEAIAKWGAIGAALALAAAATWFWWRWCKEHSTAAKVITSIESVKQSGLLVISDAAAKAMNVIQGHDGKALVNTVQEKLPVAGVAKQGGQP